MDEAHNAKTDTTFETLKRIAPSVILELTATAVPKKTNVLYSVSARELQAEDMIKLPVLLAEHKDWQSAVRDAVLRRSQLEAEAAHETVKTGQHLRPILLFQAQDKNGEVTPEVLRQHLLNEKLVGDRQEIVVATGEQRGLDGIDLFDPACAVRHVITVEALKEGWDCFFAYALCSLQNVRSGKDVEQLLDRFTPKPGGVGAGVPHQIGGEASAPVAAASANPYTRSFGCEFQTKLGPGGGGVRRRRGPHGPGRYGVALDHSNGVRYQ